MIDGAAGMDINDLTLSNPSGLAVFKAYVQKNNNHGRLTMKSDSSKSLTLDLLLATLLCVCFLTFPLRVHAGQAASPFVNSLSNPTPAECLLNWAELNYPACLHPAGRPGRLRPSTGPIATMR